MLGNPNDLRRAKGVNFIELVKMLKAYRRQHPVEGLSEEAAALLDGRILAATWYPLRVLQELLRFVYVHMLDSDPDKALRMGIEGGKLLWTDTHRVHLFRELTDTLSSMRYAWGSYFDFGALEVEVESEHAVRFTVTGYPDAPEIHCMIIAGWHLAAARLGGATHATTEILERPWRGDSRFVHRIAL